MKNRYIALLRGINVGGHKKFPKAAQEALLESLDYHIVKVYLHTGNWIFETSAKKETIAASIHQVIKEKYNWEVPIIILEASELVTIFDNCPFSEAKKQHCYFMILNKAIAISEKDALEKRSTSEETFVIINNCVYIVYSKGAGKAKFGVNWFEKKLQETATARNYNTMLAIKKLCYP